MTTYTVGLSDADYIVDQDNDQIQINSALAAAKAVPGSTVYLKGPCTYDIQDSVQIGNSTTLTGDSTAILRIHNGMTWAAQVPVIKQSNSIASNITIFGFQIDCNRWNQTGDEGDGLFNGINLAGSSTSHGSNVSVHDMVIYDSLGDGIQLKYIDNVTAYNNNISVMGHEGIYFIGNIGGDAYNNTIEQKDNSCIRVDNGQNINIHNNTTSKYDETEHPTVANGNGAIQIGNRPASYNMLLHCNNINIYDNTINNGAGSGILLMDADGSQGTTAQNVKIWNNVLTGCGWMRNIQYNAGISVWNWGNGLKIFNNTISGSYNAGFLVYNSIASGCTVYLKDNNITGTLATLATDPARKLPVTGYGVLNYAPSKMAVYAENNYVTSNLTGNYYQVTPISEATALNGEWTSGGTSGGSTGTVTPATRYIPPIRIIQEDYEDYYDPLVPKQGYINGVKFYWQELAVDGGKSVGQKKAPGVIGDNLTDFGFKGTGLVIDCYAFSPEEMDEVMAAWYDTSRGRSRLELGSIYAGTICRGLAVDNSSKLRLTEDVPENAKPYSILYQMDLPYKENADQKVRGRYVTGSMQWSSDDTYAGNLLKNPSFESWAKSTDLDWVIGTSPVSLDNEWRCVRWSKELAQFCAVSRGTGDATGTRIAISTDGDTFTTPSGLTNATNYDERWASVVWGQSIGYGPSEDLPGRWVAVGISGSIRAIFSDDGITWEEAGFETLTNMWGDVCYIYDGDEGKFRYLAVSYGASETHRVMFSDDGGYSWIDVASADDSYQWLSVAYSPTLKIVVAVAYGRDAGGNTGTMWSDDYGETWTLGSSPATTQQWSSVVWADHISKFVAVALDGNNNQIMTSEDGKTWTAQVTPYSGSTITAGTGSVVSTTTYQSPSGYVYTTKDTDYTTSACSDASTGGILSIEAPGTGHKWRIDRVFCRLRSGGTCCNAYFKITAQTATKAETTLGEWNTNSISYIPESTDVTFEAANDETVTLTVYMKSGNDDIKAIATDIGYVLTEWDGAGGSSIAYTVNQWRAITAAPEINLIVASAQTGTGNRIMYSADAVNWILGESAADNNWYSLCYSPVLNKFVSVAGSGTGNRLMTSGTYGAITTPSSWTVAGTGQRRSEATAHDGLYSILIEGDGTTADLGLTEQYVYFEPGVSYVLSAWGAVSGRTAGKLSVDIYSGNSIITQLLWDEDCEYTQLQETVRFDTAPVDAMIRVHVIETANDGALFYCDDVLLEKASDFEIGTTGSPITTTGHVDIIPDVEVKAITSQSSSNVSKGATITVVDGDVHSRTETAYVVDYTSTLPALSNGEYYRFDRFSLELGTANVSGVTGYAKVTIKCASLNNNAETTVATWSTTTRLPSRTAKSIDTEYFSGTNEAVTIKVYLKTTNSSAKVSADNISYTYTKMIPTVVSSAISIYNTADTLTIMQCCNELKPGCSIRINADGTGNYKYSENFSDGQYDFTITDSSGITYNIDEKILMFGSAGYITYKFDTKYPITGIPYIVINVIQGAPVCYIAADNAGSPGTWYAVDDVSTTDLTNVSAYRLLNSGTTLILNGLTKFHLKIVSGGTSDLHINSIFMYSDLVTIDAERPKIFKGQQNTFGASVTSTASANIILYYRDADILS